MDAMRRPAGDGRGDDAKPRATPIGPARPTLPPREGRIDRPPRPAAGGAPGLAGGGRRPWGHPTPGRPAAATPGPWPAIVGGVPQRGRPAGPVRPDAIRFAGVPDRRSDHRPRRRLRLLPPVRQYGNKAGLVV